MHIDKEVIQFVELLVAVIICSWNTVPDIGPRHAHAETVGDCHGSVWGCVRNAVKQMWKAFHGNLCEGLIKRRCKTTSSA